MRRSSFLLLFLLALVSTVQAQRNPFGRLGGMANMGGGRGGGGREGSNDSLTFEKRNFADDSASIRFRYLDSARYRALDSSISDFFDRVAMKADHVNLGNNGTATRSLLFKPIMKAGWDHGFHGFDPFLFSINDTRFMVTDKPYTELTYLLGSKSEQTIGVLHTQNITPDWNAGLQYRLINAPGFFNSQNTNHKNFRFHSNYTSKNKRYNAFLVVISNGIQSSENGGIKSDTFLVNKNPAYNDFFNIPTNLAQSPTITRNFFNVSLSTGNKYSNAQFLLRQQYDLGKKDSVVTDSTVTRFFLPRFRFEHTIQYNSYGFTFLDQQVVADSPYYRQFYGLRVTTDTVPIQFKDRWSELSNDFSVVQFPDPTNPLQFLKLGATLFNYTGTFSNGKDQFSNVMLHGEYRNRTKNRKWDMLLKGSFFSIGRSIGNYDLQANIRSFLGKKWGYVELGAQNVNRDPSYLFLRKTSFPVLLKNNMNDENIIHLYGSTYNPLLKLKLSADYYLLSNFSYITHFNKVEQAGALFNLLRIGINKEVNVAKNWRWYLDLYLQQATGNAPVNIPLGFVRSRFAYEGKLFTNLRLSTGVDIRYNTPYRSPGYSPVLGQFFFQEVENVVIRPDIAGYVNFKIRNFTGFTRLENLNTLTFKNGFGFKQSNVPTTLYPTPGLLLRIGIYWVMIN